MDKILFLVPAPIVFEDFIHPDFNARIVGKYASVLTDMPLGVLSMSAYLKKHITVDTKLIDFSVILNEIKDFNYKSFKDFFIDYLTKEVLDYKPTIICISALFTPAYYSMLDLAECCKVLFPESWVLVGGGVPTNMYKIVLSNSTFIDAICYGEGEKPLLEFVRSSNKYKYIDESPSWITRNKVGKNLKYNHIEDLDEIPFYDYKLCQVEKYKLNPAIEAYSAIDKIDQNFHIMTSRGCPHRCTFCASSTVHGRHMRYHSISRVIADIKQLIDKYHAKIIVVQDDHFLGDKKRALEIIKHFKELGIKVVFQNALALYALDRQLLTTLKESGVDQLVLAIESGSDRVLREIMHKPVSCKLITKIAKLGRELGIYMDANILIGSPGETKQDIEDTRHFLRTIYANWFRITAATPIVGSEMLKICLEKDYLVGDYMSCHYKKPIIQTEDFTPEYIKDIIYTLNLELNFIYNSDFRLGEYKTALHGFENAIRAKSNHAVAYYYASKCYEQLGEENKAATYMTKAMWIKETDPFWKNYMEKYGL